MQLTDSILKSLNRGATRGVLRWILAVGYKLRGISPESIRYHKNSNSWEYRIDGVSYLSSGPGWAYNYDFLIDQLKQLSGNHYLPKAGDIVVDIGAGVGEETIIFSKLVGNSGKVLAIEAHPKTFLALDYMVKTNGLRNVTCMNIALSDKYGEVEIGDSDNSLANTILPSKTKKTYQVKGYTFDEMIRNNGLQRIDLVKMNVEGAEQLIIKGMAEYLPIVKNIAISCHDFLYERGGSEFFKTREIVVEFLKRNNFIVAVQKTNVKMVDDYIYAVNANPV